MEPNLPSPEECISPAALLCRLHSFQLVLRNDRFVTSCCGIGQTLKIMWTLSWTSSS